MAEALAPKKELKPTRQERLDLAASALALIGERGPASYRTGFDPYGGLETHIALFEIEDGRAIRVGTMQDDYGHEYPDFHIVITNPTDEQTEDGTPIARDTTYDFWFRGFFRPTYGITAQQELVTYEHEPRRNQSNRWALNLKDGLEAHGVLSDFNFPIRVGRSKPVSLVFDRQAFEDLKKMIAECNPSKLVFLDAGEIAPSEREVVDDPPTGSGPDGKGEK